MATIKKAKNGSPVKGNPKGYEKSTSPMKTGAYEKKLDTIGSGSNKSVRMISGKGEVLGQERLGSSGAKKLSNTFNRSKTYTDERRKENKDFLDSRKATGKVASKLQKGGTVKKVVKAKKYSPTAKEAKNIKDATKMKNMRPVMKSGGAMGKCKNGCK
jgi:hypothetical protein